MATASGEHPVSALEPSLPFVLYRRPVAAARAGTRARRAAEEPRRRLSSLLVSACSVHVVPGPVQRLDQSIEWRVARCFVRDFD